MLNVVFILQAAGCEPGDLVASAAETHVNKDGSAERRILLDARPPGPKLAMTDAWSLKSRVDTKGRSVSRSVSYEDLTTDKDHGGIALKVEDYFFWRTYSFSDRADGLLSAGQAVSGKTGYKLVMPGRIYKAPGAARKAGSVSVYGFQDGDEVWVRAWSWSMRWWALALTVGILTGAGALILGGRMADVVRGAGRWLWTGRLRGDGQR